MTTRPALRLATPARLAGVALSTGLAALSLAVLWPHGVRMRAVLVLAVLGAAAMAARRGLVGPGLAVFGATTIFFGYQPYTVPGLFAVFWCALVSLALLLHPAPAANAPAPGPAWRPGAMELLFWTLVAQAVVSTLRLPLWDMARTALELGPVKAYALMSRSTAESPWYALAAVVRFVVPAVFAAALAGADVPARFERLAQGLAVGLLAALVYGLALHFRDDTYIFHYRFTSVFANPGWLAEYLTIAAPCLLLFTVRRGRLGRGAVLAGLGLCAACLILTMARGGWIAAGLTAGIGAALLLRRPEGRVAWTGKQRLVPVLALCCLAAVLAAWVAGRGLERVSRPINALLAERLANFTESPRPGLFKAAGLIALEEPFFGLGFESYARHYPILLHTPGSWLNRHGDPSAEVFETSHSLYFQLFSGLGLFGLAVYLALVALCAARLFRRQAACRDPLALAMLLSLIAFHLYAAFQEMLYVPAVGLLLFPILSRGLALEREDVRSTGRGAPKTLVAAVLIGLAASLVVAVRDAGMRATAAAHGLADYADPASAVSMDGFFHPENVGGRVMRWSSGVSVLAAPGGTLELWLAPPPIRPGLAPIEAELSVNGRPAARVGLDGSGARRVLVELPERPGGGRNRLVLTTSRVVHPNVELGAPDHRPLGVAVGARLLDRRD